MSRNAVAHDSAGESFAGLLEHLTRHARPEPSALESRPDVASQTNRASASLSRSGARSDTRSLVPVTELKAGRGAATPDSTPLSYEQALRLIARRKPPANGDFDVPPIPPAITPSQPETAPNPLSRKTAKTARTGPSDHPSQSFARARNAAQSAPEPPEVPKTPAARRAKRRTKSSSPAKFQAKSRAKDHSTNREHLGDSPSSAPTAASPPPSAQFLSEAISGSRRKPQLKPKSKPNSKSGSSARHLNEGKNLEKVERRDLQWNSAWPSDLMSPADQRRAIVSLRLTEGEFLRLKDRAGESGISVSAYMRSCIVDADQLRTQVKQALAEMRALSARPERARPEPNHFPALPPPGSSGSGNGGDWFRTLMRSAAFLLSPLFPFRRSA